MARHQRPYYGMTMEIAIPRERLIQELETLAAFSDAPAPAVTRVVFSEKDLQARAWFRQLCREASLDIREDAVGNTFARWHGSEPDLPAIGTGSHIDAIPHSGRYDGTVGVLGGLAAMRALQEAGFRPRRSLELLLFTSEEPTRFGIGCFGSRLLAGTLEASADDTLKDGAGATLKQCRTQAGFQGSVESVLLPRGYYDAFVELHIEQGPLLERRGVPIGAVTAIAAPASLRIGIEGSGGHAGAVLMPDRRDAFLAAAEIALALEAAAKSTGSIDSVATTGVCDIFPRAINSIPSRVQMEADIRDINEARRDGMLAKLKQACDEVAARRGLTVTTEFINRDSPAICDPRIVDAIAAGAALHGLACDRMVSRAYHDSLFLSRVCPTSMIFIPCRDGVSHRPDEYASPEAIASGTLVLAETMALLSAKN
jgi:N-carbamoyl-L-amino-acid hydrolase